MASPILTPAGYVTQQAIAFSAEDSSAVAVGAVNPLLVASPGDRPAASTPLSGTTGASTVAGPFTPQLGRTITLSLSGIWSGLVQL